MIVSPANPYAPCVSAVGGSLTCPPQMTHLVPTNAKPRVYYVHMYVCILYMHIIIVTTIIIITIIVILVIISYEHDFFI
jgi:hypothetical protein